MKKNPIFIAAALVLLSSLLWYFFAPADDGSYQGYIEGEFLYVAAEEGGRIENLATDDGKTVQSGDILFTLNSDLHKELYQQASAALKQTMAQERDLRSAMRRPEEMAVLYAQKESVQAQRDLSKANFERQKQLRERGFASQAIFDQAQAAYERDKAAYEEIQKQIEVGELSSRSDAVKAGEAAVEAARAALRQIEIRIAKLSVQAPASAVVHKVYFRKGEVVTAGQPVLSLLPPKNRILRFFVPETDIAKIHLGDKVRVTCDACPENLFATVSFISDTVEFTPPIIFSEQERSKLIFRVEAKPFEVPSLPVGLPVSVFSITDQKHGGK